MKYSPVIDALKEIASLRPSGSTEPVARRLLNLS
jgi:hypothetical protein